VVDPGEEFILSIRASRHHHELTGIPIEKANVHAVMPARIPRTLDRRHLKRHSVVVKPDKRTFSQGTTARRHAT